MKEKKKLTLQQEFEIMKLVLDKFLWFGFGIMAYGLYKIMSVTQGDSFIGGISYMLTGALLLTILMILIVREYEINK